jgi:integrase/recombinase XerD
MTSDTSPRPVSPLRARMIEDMTVRGFNERTRGHYVRHVRAFAAFIGRSPDAATAEDLRLFQLHQTQIGMQPPSINGAVSLPRRPCRRPGCGDQEARVATHAAA